jgi:uncharacterized membrane protein
MFGKPGEGPHAYRFMGIAVVDTVLTFLAAWLITLATGYSIQVTFGTLFILGEVLHYYYGTQTAVLTMLGIKVSCASAT